MISIGRERTQLEPVGMNSEQEMSQQETKKPLYMSQYVVTGERVSTWISLVALFRGHYED